MTKPSMGILILSLLLTSPALAGQGWYLLYPNLDLMKFAPNADWSQLKDWSQGGAYDTAEQCEQNRFQWIQRAKKEDAKVPKKDQVKELTIATSSRCIASDDPRLKGQ